SMNNAFIREKLAHFPGLSLHFGEFSNKISAYNAYTTYCTDWNVLVVTSDDMIPQVHGYDKIIIDRMCESFSDTDGVLHFNDGYTGQKLATIPIMGRRYYDRFHYVYHPSYKSLWADNEYVD